MSKLIIACIVGLVVYSILSFADPFNLVAGVVAAAAVLAM